MRYNYIFFYIFFVVGILGIGFVQPVSAAAGEPVDFLSDDFYEDEPADIEVNDPIEPFNRAMFQFNDKTYTYIFNPVAEGYSAVVPIDIRGIIDNFFRNLEEPVRFLNCLLQGRFSDAGSVFVRFLSNSTIGVGGLVDFADRELGFEPVDATLGETMGVWGIGDGFYLVVPFFGSSTLRDFTGTIIDGLALTPYYTYIDNWNVKTGIYAGKTTNELSLHLGEYEDLKKLSFDPYIALRNGYFQYRKKIRDHRVILDSE
jgi:phospholipid-binding lipoprotein MlaA